MKDGRNKGKEGKGDGRQCRELQDTDDFCSPLSFFRNPGGRK
jgi:hypothetical protein